MGDGNSDSGKIELQTNRNQTSSSSIPEIVHNPYYEGSDNMAATKSSSMSDLQRDNIEINTITVTQNLYYE